MIKIFLIFCLYLIPVISLGQIGTVKGRVFNAINNESIPFAKIKVIGLSKGAISNEDGLFEIDGLNPGVYSFKASVSGFKERIVNEI